MVDSTYVININSKKLYKKVISNTIGTDDKGYTYSPTVPPTRSAIDTNYQTLLSI